MDTNTQPESRENDKRKSPQFDTAFGKVSWPEGWDSDEGMIPGKDFKAKYGDIVVNGAASVDNPNRVGIFVNADSRYVILWNGDARVSGKWKVVRDSRFKIIGNTRAGLAARSPRDEEAVERECKSFALWLENQRPAGKTVDYWWNEYVKTFPLNASKSPHPVERGEG